MKHAHSITSLLLKLFLVGSSQIFCASWAPAQSLSLSEQGAAPEDSLSASPPWQQLLSDLSASEDFENVAWQDYEEDLGAAYEKQFQQEGCYGMSMLHV